MPAPHCSNLILGYYLLSLIGLTVYSQLFNPTYFAEYDNDKQQNSLVQRKSFFGYVSAGNYTYYNVEAEGKLKIVVKSMEGDADIYISSKTNNPTFDLEEHELQSVTCGLDTVYVNRNFKRPFTVAIYGYPSHTISKYRFDVILYDEYTKGESKVSDDDLWKQFSYEKNNFDNSIYEKDKQTGSVTQDFDVDEKDKNDDRYYEMFLSKLILNLLYIIAGV